MPDTNQSMQLLRLPSVLNKTGLSRSEILRRVKLGTFPRPIKLGVRSVAWSSDSVNTWIVSVIKAGSAD